MHYRFPETFDRHLFSNVTAIYSNTGLSECIEHWKAQRVHLFPMLPLKNNGFRYLIELGTYWKSPALSNTQHLRAQIQFGTRAPPFEKLFTSNIGNGKVWKQSKRSTLPFGCFSRAEISQFQKLIDIFRFRLSDDFEYPQSKNRKFRFIQVRILKLRSKLVSANINAFYFG